MVVKYLSYAENRPDEAALIDEWGETSWSELNRRVNRLVHAFRTLGLQAGDRVGMLSGNRREAFEVFSACAHASLLVVPMNWHFSEDEVRYVLDDSGARVLVVDSRFEELARSGAPAGVELLVTSGDDGDSSYESALAAASAEEPDDQGAGGVMFYTSGTTGRPKGVRRKDALGAPIQAQAPQALGFSAMLGIPAEGRTLVCGPVYHSAQWAFSMFPLEMGSTIVSRHRFDPLETLQLIDHHAITNVHLVPTQFVRLLRLSPEERDAFRGDSLVQVLHGAAPCSQEVKKGMIDWWGPVVTEYYGGTEGAVISTISAAEWLERPTSVGRPLPIVEVSVVADDGSPCAAGEEGQLYIKSLLAPGFEYHNDSAKTQSVHRAPGVFTMGDVGFLDDEGYLHLTDRKIDLIISGGVNIYPAEVERVLQDHPAVDDVAVLGVPDDEYGEKVKAVVVLLGDAAGSQELEAELIRHCQEYLARFKAPRSIDFVDSLPRQASGKLLKGRLRQSYRDAQA